MQSTTDADGNVTRFARMWSSTDFKFGPNDDIRGSPNRFNSFFRKY